MSQATTARWLPADRDGRHHGLQLVSAMLIAYLLSAALGLPESLWAVMSTPIVMRPNAGATLSAGWDRVGATLVGALCGLAGVQAQQLGAPVGVATLTVVGGLAWVSGALPALRSAPIAALIILAAGELAGHSALQVAGLRVMQIGIGVGVAVSVSLLTSRYRAGPRLRSGCALLLRRVAQPLLAQPPRVHSTQTPAQAEAAGAAMRSALGRLAELARHADQESRLFRRPGSPTRLDAWHHRRIAWLTGRVAQDAAVLVRLAQPILNRRADGLARDVTQAASAALLSVADALSECGPSDLAWLRELTGAAAQPTADADPSRRSAAALAGPLQLLLGDLQQLGGCLASDAFTPRPHR